MLTIILTEQEWLTVLNGLANRPYGEVAEIIKKMQAQFTEQKTVPKEGE